MSDLHRTADPRLISVLAEIRDALYEIKTAIHDIDTFDGDINGDVTATICT